MAIYLLFLLIIANLLKGCNSSAPSFTLINSDGIIRSSSQISKYLSDALKQTSTDSIRLIQTIDCISDSDELKSGYSFLNGIFGTNFRKGGVGRNGLLLEIKDSAIYLYASFDSIYSGKFNGCKALDFYQKLPGKLCIALKAIDIDSVLVGYDQLFRRVLNYAKERIAADTTDATVAPQLELSFIVSSEGASTADEAALNQKILSHLNRIVSETDKTATADQIIRISTSLSPVKANTILEGCQVLAAGPDGIQAIATQLSDAWNSLPAEPSPLLSPLQQESLYRIEVAYTAALAQADIILSQWQKRVSSGKQVGHFAQRVISLLDSLSNEFNKKTAGSALVRERSERLRSLQDHALTLAGRLSQQQLAALETQAAAAYQKELLKLLREAPSAAQEGEEAKPGQKELQEQALRKTLFSFKAQAAEIESEQLGPAFDGSPELQRRRLDGLAESLEAIRRDFPESSIAKLEELRKTEREAASTAAAGSPRMFGRRGRGQGRGKGAKAVGAGIRIFGLSPKISNIALNLVGMLRPPGLGNLQGFVGYATSLLGLPLDLMLGVHNDGESPEIMGEDREYPILRVQPKVHFDIDF